MNDIMIVAVTTLSVILSLYVSGCFLIFVEFTYDIIKRNDPEVNELSIIEKVLTIILATIAWPIFATIAIRKIRKKKEG